MGGGGGEGKEFRKFWSLGGIPPILPLGRTLCTVTYQRREGGRLKLRVVTKPYIGRRKFKIMNLSVTYLLNGPKVR